MFLVEVQVNLCLVNSLLYKKNSKTHIFPFKIFYKINAANSNQITQIKLQYMFYIENMQSYNVQCIYMFHNIIHIAYSIPAKSVIILYL